MEEKAHGPEKSHAPCKCRDCSPVTAMWERLDAYKAAQALLKEIPSNDDDPHTPHEHLILANWLYYGGGDGDDD